MTSSLPDLTEPVTVTIAGRGVVRTEFAIKRGPTVYLWPSGQRGTPQYPGVHIRGITLRRAQRLRPKIALPAGITVHRTYLVPGWEVRITNPNLIATLVRVAYEPPTDQAAVTGALQPVLDFVKKNFYVE